MYLTLADIREGGELRWEVVKLNNYSSNVLSVTRGQDGTTGQAWLADSSLSNRVTAGGMQELENFKDASRSITLTGDVVGTVSYTGTGAVSIGTIIASTKFAPVASPVLTGTPTAPTAAAGTNTTQLATTEFVTAADNTLLSNHLAATDPHPQYTTAAELETRIAALVASSPSALDTLNELATALGDDPNFATTVTNALAGKAPIASPTFTGKVIVPQGSAANPGLVFTGDISNDTGLYLNADGNLGVTCNGSQVASFTPGAVSLQGTATGTSFNGITALASVAPLAAGTAAVGTSTAVARQDHVHPLQTTLSASAPITTVIPTKATAITGATSGSINVPEVTLASGELFATALHQVTTVIGGYRQHISIGSYRAGINTYAGGCFVAVGNNDNNPTEYYSLGLGGNITHSSGSTFWNNLNDGSGSGLDADTVDGLHIGQSGVNYIPYANASGNVGIGTSTPASKLDLGGTISSTETIRFTMGGNVAEVSSTGNGTANGLGNLSFNTRDGSVMQTRIKIAEGGNVLIGTTTDNGVDRLQVNGSISTTTAAPGTSNNQVATTAFVTAADNLKANNSDLLMAIGNINAPLLDLPLKNSLAMKSGVGSVTFTRASTATYIDRYGMLQVAGVDTPRFEKQGYLNESVTTNLLTYSEQFDNSAWAKANVTVSANTTATLDPYGTNWADKLVEDTSTGIHYISQTLTVSSSTLTFSCFVKAAESTKFRLNSWDSTNSVSPILADFDLTAVTATPANSSTVSATITPIANGWFRVSATTTTAAKVSISFYLEISRLDNSYTGDGVSGLYVFGAQLETWPFATSYIPTTSSSVTRASDILNFTRSGNIPNIEANGIISVLCDIDVFGTTGNNQWVWALYVSSSDHIGLTFSTASGSAHVWSSTEGSALAFVGISPRTTYRIAQVASNAGHYVYKNGVQVGFKSDTDGRITQTCNSSFSTVRMGSYNPAETYGPNSFNGHISNFRVYDRALTAYEASLA
jgi:hypothetical protein